MVGSASKIKIDLLGNLQEKDHVKPIFHCDAKPFTLGTGVGLDPQRHTFASMLVSFALGDANFSRHPMQNPNASQWNIGCIGFQTENFLIGHVHFMFFVLISFAFGGQRKPSIQWNMGFNHVKTVNKHIIKVLVPRDIDK